MKLAQVILLGGFRAEKIGVPEAILLSLVGMAVVFVVLILLQMVIRALASLSKGKAEAPAPETDAEAAPAMPAPALVGKVPAPGSIGECDLYTVDDKSAALLMAIVADDLKAPLNELRFISIKECDRRKAL